MHSWLHEARRLLRPVLAALSGVCCDTIPATKGQRGACWCRSGSKQAPNHPPNVYWRGRGKKRWQANITVQRERLCEYHHTMEEAVEAVEAFKRLHGHADFTQTNGSAQQQPGPKHLRASPASSSAFTATNAQLQVLG